MQFILKKVFLFLIFFFLSQIVSAQFKVDTKSIKIPLPFRIKIENIKSLTVINDSVSCYYDDVRKSIDFVNTNQFLYLNSINLLDNKKINFSKYGKVSAILYLSDDSIFIFQFYKIFLITKNGKLINSWEVTNNDNYFFLTQLSTGFPPFFDVNKQMLYIERNPLEQDKIPLNFAKEGIINLSSKRYDTLPVFYPSSYQSLDLKILTVSRAVRNNAHYYSFTLDPDIYVVEESKLQKFSGKSRFQGIDIKDIPKDEKESYRFIMSPLYYNLLYDKYRDLFYRFFFKEVPLKDEQKLYNTFNEKKLFFQVFDANLNIIHEIELDRKKYWFYAMVLPQGLAIAKMNSTNEEFDGQSLLFDIFSVNK